MIKRSRPALRLHLGDGRKGEVSCQPVPAAVTPDEGSFLNLEIQVGQVRHILNAVRKELRVISRLTVCDSSNINVRSSSEVVPPRMRSTVVGVCVSHGLRHSAK